ncbi:3-hydroxyacyl-CoA dehydrogenase NAD-binding domain-containing protein [Zhongshania sp.]|jgi:enoyl-CoA hydratase/3-hydroxyacyl-CoA dehydrogenase|uniref:3-hydroxyacyl-CoA dehydrogenase NAD-binding domain-containing protein n=1 Tax=Zhongshania sp. TaxID=1971902 RepID=UPI0039E2A131
MQISEITTVCFIGAGTMGRFNALMAAAAGYESILYDVSTTVLNETREQIGIMAAMLVHVGFFSEEEVHTAMQNIRIEPDLALAVQDAQLVSESVAERLDIKRSVHQGLALACPSTAILTTNTSTLLVSQIDGALPSDRQFAALHSHLGARLIDIVSGTHTSAATIDVLRRYVLSINGVPLILKKESPGYVLNTLLGSLLGMALGLVLEGGMSIEDIDRAWIQGAKAPMGPFGMIDLFGLDVVHDSWAHQQSDPQNADLRTKVIALLSSHINAGKLGMKSGQGFYQYPAPSYENADFTANGTGDDLYKILAGTVIEQAILLAKSDVATTGDIDRAWMCGTGALRGPFGDLDEQGIVNFLNAYRSYRDLGIFTRAKVEVVEGFLAAQVVLGRSGKQDGQGFYRYPEPLFEHPDFLRGEAI